MDSVLKILNRKDDRLNQWISDEDVYRTAPATTGYPMLQFFKKFIPFRQYENPPLEGLSGWALVFMLDQGFIRGKIGKIVINVSY